MCFSGGGGSDKAAQQARADEQARQQRISEGVGQVNKIYKGIEPTLAARGKAYEAYANPQLEQQYRGQKERMAYNLASSGLTSSSEAARQAGDLQRQYNMGRSTIASEGVNQVNQARRQVEQDKADLIAQLNATGDARMAANAALNRAALSASQPGFSPIGNLFQQGTGLLANAAQAGYYDPSSRGLGAYGLSQPRRQENRIVR